MFKAQKRFVAGAVCPRCGEQDKLVMFSDEGETFRECVACDFSEKMRFQKSVRELDTRVNRSAADQSEARPVKLIDPGA
ncbi:MAG: YheV family putative zinc ribbon protein [Porticoccaceae bacterium]|nr:YheV family putative metal-binding protein [Pseudomonadales bacterium]MCP5172969.1 YheV family putative metal-binding protein [Pseudomonadales bacterium]MCP5302442.1 YheV family putative metal-binding protein [Pseudomonadales bacterium]